MNPFTPKTEKRTSLHQNLDLLPAYDTFDYDVMKGNISGVRKWFELAFWSNQPIKPEWMHLKHALQKKRYDMAKLLLTHGAEVDFRFLARHPEAVTALKRMGFPPDRARLVQAQEEWKSAPALDLDPSHIPAEWKNILAAITKDGASACVGGGALRDLFNKKAIKDVDIFLRDWGSESANMAVVNRALKRCGLTVHDQEIRHGYSVSVQKFVSHSFNNRSLGQQCISVVAGKNKTQYDFIFVDDFAPHFTSRLIERFDFTFCQIAYDGGSQRLMYTDAFEEDCRDKIIRISDTAASSSHDHAVRVTQKYADWKMCLKTRELLKPAPTASRFAGY